MGILRVMHPVHGDTKVIWEDTPASIAETRIIFDQLMKSGMTGVITIDGQEVATRKFDPTAREIEVIAPLEGG